MGAVNGDCDGKRWHACRTVFQVHAQPFVPFAVRLLSAACDMMVTASHNPKDDNGYKVLQCLRCIRPMTYLSETVDVIDSDENTSCCLLFSDKARTGY